MQLELSQLASFPEQYQPLLEKLVAAAVQGGEAINSVLTAGNVTIYTKEGTVSTAATANEHTSDNFMTAADLASHNAILDILGEQLDGIPVITEESQTLSSFQGSYIVVDDLDGTGELIKQQPGFMVLVMYVAAGVPILSANYNPSTKELFIAVKDHGSYIYSFGNNSWQKLRLNQGIGLDSANVIVNGRDKERPENADYYQFMQSNFGTRLTAGLATGSRMSAILQGHQDVFVNNGSETLKAWDLGMVLNILEAGGYVCRKNGELIDFNDIGLVTDIICATNKNLAEQMVDLLRKYDERQN